MMNIAYIITAYIDPKQLGRLIKRLQLSDELGHSDFFIHIDKKVDEKPFRDALKSESNVYWCSNRYWINWGGFNQVLSQMELLSMVFDEGKRDYDRVICLSATDYPLKSNEALIDMWQQDVEYIGGFNLCKCNDELQKRKVKDYHFFRDLNVSLKLRRALSGSFKMIMHALPIKKPLHFVGLQGAEYDAYTGSDYWALTGKCARFVYETMLHDAKLMDYFRYSYIPSEGVVNTIVFNSEYKAKCTHLCNDPLYPGLEAITPLHHTQYHGAIKVYNKDDIAELDAVDKAFFRKARTGVSDSLIEILDTRARHSIGS